jgi:hypothetical protein
LTVTSNVPDDHAILTTPLRAVGEFNCATLNVAVPLPIPEPPDATVMKDCCGVAVHEHPGVREIASENVPAVNGTETVVGVTENTHVVWPCCVIVMLCPAMVSVPERAVVSVFAAIENRAVPVPDPLPVVTETKDGTDVVVQVQSGRDGLMVTSKEPAVLGRGEVGPVNV